MAHWKLVLEYDGTDFAGWQRQAGDARTVQGALERAVREVCGAEPRVRGAGRTDAGVHALAQVADVEVETRLCAAELARALNAVLPPDVAVVALGPAPPGFHARYAARGKHYRYRVWNGPVRSPLRARHWHWEPRLLDLPAMLLAARACVGTHDFRSFQAAGSDVADAVRTLRRLEVAGTAGGEVAIDAEASGFLRHMVRNLAGTLLEVGLGRLPAGALPDLLAARDRAAAGPTAPARGLVLVGVSYDDPGAPGFPRNPGDFGPPLA